MSNKELNLENLLERSELSEQEIYAITSVRPVFVQKWPAAQALANTATKKALRVFMVEIAGPLAKAWEYKQDLEARDNETSNCQDWSWGSSPYPVECTKHNPDAQMEAALATYSTLKAQLEEPHDE